MYQRAGATANCCRRFWRRPLAAIDWSGQGLSQPGRFASVRLYGRCPFRKCKFWAIEGRLSSSPGKHYDPRKPVWKRDVNPRMKRCGRAKKSSARRRPFTGRAMDARLSRSLSHESFGEIRCFMQCFSWINVLSGRAREGPFLERPPLDRSSPVTPSRCRGRCPWRSASGGRGTGT